MKKRIIALSTLLTLALACGSALSVAAKGDKESVRIALMTTGFVAPLNYAYEQGYFDELGVDVSVDYFSNGPAINEAIAAGDIDFGGIGEMPIITGAIRNNSKLVGWVCDDEASIQGYARNDSDLVAAGSGYVADHPEIYGTPETWTGKSVLCAKGTSSHYALLATLDLMGLKESDIEFVNMDGASGAAAFGAGTGDIFFGFDPQWAAFYADADQYTQVSTCENAGRKLGDVLIASNDFVENHGETLTKVLQAVVKAQEELAADEAVYQEAMFNWQTSYGTSTKEITDYSAAIKSLYTSEQLIAIFDETNGTSQALESLDTVAQFMVDNEVISEEEKEACLASEPIKASFLMQAIENLKQ